VDGSRERANEYEDLFAPVCRAVTFRLLLIYALDRGYQVHQADVKQAFNNTPVAPETNIFVRCPPGYEREGMVMRLRKYAYGLRVSPLKWTQYFATWMTSIGFTQSKIDQCLFFRDGMYVCVYCDDILYTGTDSAMREYLEQLKLKFGIHELGSAATYTGVQIERTNTKLVVHQKKYIEQILERFGMTDAPQKRTPMELTLKLKVMVGECTDKKLQNVYRQKVGALMYLACSTMPGISYAVKELSRHLQHPTTEHMQACDRVFAYLRYALQTGQYRLTYTRGGRDLLGACDASWADIFESARSTSGVLFMYRGAALVWYSQTQRCVTHSSTESEYVALDATVREYEYVCKIMGEFKLEVPRPMTVLEDNKSCICMTAKTVDHQRTKHVRLRYHYVRDLVLAGNIRMQHQHTDYQPADLLTKQLGEIKQHRFNMYVLGLKDLDLVTAPHE
jgi:hypothetical protein